MNIRSIPLLILILFAYVPAQQQVLLRIGNNGVQEAIPLKKGETAKDVIERLENAQASYAKAVSGAGLVDTIRYFISESELTTNFGWNHQDVAFQWYNPQAGGIVKEFWWRNYVLQGSSKRATIRAWYTNPKILTIPIAFDATGRMGYYSKVNDGDGNVTPFKEEATSEWFYKGNGGDTTAIGFDPLSNEAIWKPGGVQVILDSNKWQGIKLAQYGIEMAFRTNEPFGFTLMNDSKVSDKEDIRMEILSKSSDGAPYHSIKFYELPTAPGNTPGWQIRSYEWGMYVVVEYSPTPNLRINVVSSYGTMITPGVRTICATIYGDFLPGSDSITAYLHYKPGVDTKYDSVLMIRSGIKYCGTIPIVNSGNTVYWYISATNEASIRTVSPVRSYVIYKKNKDRLFVYNNAQYSMGTANIITNSGSTAFDRWSAPNDGIGELNTLFSMYQNIVLSDGSFPSRNVYPAIAAWLNNATESKPVSLFFNSQDYGCYITNNCSDTTFSDNAWEKILGIDKLGPQDRPPTSAEFKIVPKPDTVTNYLLKYNADSGTTLWYYPTFELGFSGYQDEFTKTENAKTLFTHSDGQGIVGIKNITPTTRTMFLGFDAGALQFRSDTALAPTSDPKHQWIVDIGSLSLSFLKAHEVITSLQTTDDIVPNDFRLFQNYPNPFNPVTTIEYSVPYQANVEIAVYNVIGQKIATMINDVHESGKHLIYWNGRDANGRLVSSGVYIYIMKSGSFAESKKLILLR